MSSVWYGWVWFGVDEFGLVWMSLAWCSWVQFGVDEFGLVWLSSVWFDEVDILKCSRSASQLSFTNFFCLWKRKIFCIFHSFERNDFRYLLSQCVAVKRRNKNCRIVLCPAGNWPITLITNWLWRYLVRILWQRSRSFVTLVVCPAENFCICYI